MAEEKSYPGGAPAPEFRLSAQQRAALYSDLDHDALERLLAALPAEAREFVLRFCRDWSEVDTEECLAAFPDVIEPLGPLGRRTFIVPQPDHLRFEDPALQAQFEAVLAPRRSP